MEKNPEQLKYFLYARRSREKSDHEENVASVEDQKRVMLDIAQKNNLKIVGTFEETKTAHKPGVRDQFNEMLSQIRSGKANAITCWKLNRIARNFLEGGVVIEMLQRGVIKEIRTYERIYLPSDNVLLLAVELGMSNQYSRELSVDVKRGLYGRAEKGYRPTTAPIGYKNSIYKTKGKDEAILVDEVRFPIVQRMFEYMATGKYTPYEVLRFANDEWGLRTKSTARYSERKLSKTAIYVLLKNPFYYGEFEYPVGSGKWYQGNHQPAVNKSTFDKVQFILQEKAGKMRPQTHKFKYTGIMRCGECGAWITAERKQKNQKNGNIHNYIYYHCSKKLTRYCSQKCLEEKVLEKQVIDYLKRITISKEFHEWALGELKGGIKTVEDQKREQLAVKKRALAECQNRLDSLLELRISNEIDAETYNEKKKLIETEKHALDEYINNFSLGTDDWIRSADDALLFAEKACYEFKNGDEEKQRAILEMFGTNHTLKDRLLTVEIQKPLELLKDMRRSYLDSRAIDFKYWVSEELSKKMEYFRELRKAWV